MSNKKLDVTDAEFEALCSYVRQVADIMGLKDWTLSVKRDAEDDSQANARIFTTMGRKIAAIQFCESFRQMIPQQQKLTIVHELIHCHLSLLDHMIHDCVKPELSRSAWTVVDAAIGTALECAVDAIADFVAPHLPEIDWGENPSAYRDGIRSF